MTTLKPRQKAYNQDGKLVFERSVDAEPVMEGVKALHEASSGRAGPAGARYLGSIDPITAANWRRECGYAIGTKGFADYAKKKIMDGEFARFRAGAY